jgi:putative phosphoesterase
MRIAILSDIHDHVWNLADALIGVQNTKTMVVCGDLCSPFIVAQLAEGFSNPIHIVFGNNDGDLYRITNIAGRYDNVSLQGEFYQGELGGKRFAVNHYNNIALPLADSGAYDVVCYGHNHIFKIESRGDALLINPGTIMGYEPVGRKNIPPTLVIYDTESSAAEGYYLVKGAQGATGKLMPYERNT